MSQENEQLEGSLNKIIFQNDTGFVIGAYTDKHNNRFTAIGTMMNPQIGMDYILGGYWVDTHNYGEQFKFSSCESIVPVDTSGIFKYIVRICRFVGPAVGNKIVDKYGNQALIIMKTNPGLIAKEIPGITFERSKEIQAALLENEETEKVMVQLESLLDIPGMRKSLPGELIKVYKSQAADAVKANPYILTNFSGVGFPLADRVALNIGYARDSIERKKAAVIHCMKENMSEGSVWIHADNLFINIQALIQVPDLTSGVHSLIEDEVIVNENNSFALTGPAEDERYIADILVSMEAII